MNDSSHHILLVEDSPSQATRMTATLEREGWKVTWAASAEAAFVELRKQGPDLVLLDYYLPGIRGDEVCRRIRMDIDTRSLPIVLLTSEESNELQALDSGADDFVLKSVDPDILVLRLRTLLQKTTGDARILSSNETPFRSARLLAIDDSPAFLERIRPELEKEGYEVEVAATGEEGLERIREKTFDGAVIDLVMPRMDGVEVCRRLNELRRSSEFPLFTVVLTGEETKENLSRALEAGADDFVGKSSDFAVLKGRIRAHLRRRFYARENARIIHELRAKELEAVRERVAREAAEARASLVEELERKTGELARSREELKRANDAKDQFLAILSHELRTPLTPILALVTQRAATADLPADIRKDMDMIRRNIELEARLIDDLLDLTRITQGKLVIRDDEVDLEQTVRHAIEMCTTSDLAQADVRLEVSSTRRMVQGDASRLTQVVWNLLRNALKFTPSDGKISLHLFEDGNKLCLEVTDTGIGIEPAKLPFVFDAFEQGGREVTRQFGGLGLGLAISKAIVELHGGTISVFSRGRNQGATFRLELPAASPVAGLDLVLPVCADAGEDAKVADPAHLRILLVEDHVDTCEIMKRLLAMRGHHVVATHSRAAAVAAAAEESFDLLISDVGLPDGNGHEVINEVSQLQSVRAIALSGYGMEKDVEASLSAGFHSHLTKPVDLAALELEISRLFAAELKSAPAPKPVPAVKISTPEPKASDKAVSILLVEDHPDTAKALRATLRGYGYDVKLVGTVADALQALIHEKFDLIVSDVGLPDGNGVSLIHGVRRFCDTPAIALTAYDDAKDVQHCLDAGFNLHMAKPVEADRLFREIQKLTRKN